MNVADVEKVVQVAIGGEAFSQMVEGEKLFDIVLRLPPELRDDPEDIGRISGRRSRHVRRQPGLPDPALAVDPIIVAHKPGASYIYRENNRRYHPDQVQRARPRPGFGHRRGQAQGERSRERGASFPQGYRIEWSGEFEQMEASQRSPLVSSSRCRSGLIMMLLYSMFNSVKDCLLVMVNVLEAAMGGVFALYLTGTHFSISAAVGFVSVFGVAVQDGVLLVTYLQPDARPGVLRLGRRCLRGPGASRAARGHDLVDGGPRAVAGGRRHLDRLAGTEAAGDRRGRRYALHAVS